MAKCFPKPKCKAEVEMFGCLYTCFFAVLLLVIFRFNSTTIRFNWQSYYYSFFPLRACITQLSLCFARRLRGSDTGRNQFKFLLADSPDFECNSNATCEQPQLRVPRDEPATYQKQSWLKLKELEQLKFVFVWIFHNIYLYKYNIYIYIMVYKWYT